MARTWSRWRRAATSTRGCVAKVESPDMYAAVDLAEAKLLAQLRKHKQKLSDHHRGEGEGFLRSADGAPPVPPLPGDETYEDVIDRMKDGVAAGVMPSTPAHP